MGMGVAPTWLRQVSPLLHMITLTTADECYDHAIITPQLPRQNNSKYM